METASNPDWDVAKLKLQPQSIEAERSVIGALLISSDSWDGVAEVVAAADFYRPEHRAIFRQIALLVDRGEPVDVVTVYGSGVNYSALLGSPEQWPAG